MNNLFTPEHMHAALNHVPFVGLVIALVPLWVGLLIKSQRTTRLTGLACVLICAASIPLVMKTGEDAYERFKTEPAMMGLLDDSGMQYMEQHYEDAELAAKPVYLLALLSAVALVLSCKAPKWGQRLSWVTAVLGVLCVAGMVWVAMSGGKIRHPEFRADFDAKAAPAIALPNEGPAAPAVGDVDH